MSTCQPHRHPIRQFRRPFARPFARLAAAMALACAAAAGAQTLSFTYQGELREAGVLADGIYDFQFTLYNQPSGGSVISSTYCADDVVVTEGRFTVELPLVTPPPNSGVFLNLAVREGSIGDCSTGGSYETLAPRQPLSRAPAATYAAAIGNNAPAITGAMRYNQALSRVELFDGAFWHNIVPVDSSNVITPPNTIGYAFPGSYNFTVPAGVTSIIVQLYGGRGGGGGLGSGTTTLPTFCSAGVGSFAAGGGGGSAGAAASYTLTVTPGENLNIVVGQGGGGGTTSGGSAGQPSRVRRGGVDIVSVPGGNGGGRASGPVPMASDPAPNACQGAIGGVGAPSAPGPTLSGPGSLISTYFSGAGAPGRGPACNGGFSPTFCAARGGQGGVPASGLFSTGAGNGGDGAGASLAAENGTPGQVFIWWY